MGKRMGLIAMRATQKSLARKLGERRRVEVHSGVNHVAGLRAQELEGFHYLTASAVLRAFDPLAVSRFDRGPLRRSFAHYFAVFVRNASAIGALPKQNLIPPRALEALSFNLRSHWRSVSPHDDEKIAVLPSQIGAGQPDARNPCHDFVKVRGQALIHAMASIALWEV